MRKIKCILHAAQRAIPSNYWKLREKKGLFPVVYEVMVYEVHMHWKANRR